VKHADKIVVINGGKVVEEGKHDELMSRNSLYKTLVEKQLQKDVEP